MIKINFDVGDLAKLAQKLGIAEKDVHYRLWLAVTRTGLKIEARAKRLAPVDTGRLRSSLVSRDVSKSRSFTVIENQIGTNVKYGIYQELGTRYIRPKLFLTRAYRENIGRLTNRLAAIAGGILEGGSIIGD